VTITLRYGGLPDLGNAASQRLLEVFRQDETGGGWEALPGQVVADSPALVTEAGTAGVPVLRVTTTRFSPLVLAGDTTTSLGDYAEPWSPSIQDFQVDLFSGAATWAVLLDVPVGR
jgi:hypothetical protein